MKKYHEDLEGNLILDEDGEPLPSYLCICHAHHPSECGCGGWDINIEEWCETYEGSSEPPKDE